MNKSDGDQQHPPGVMVIDGSAAAAAAADAAAAAAASEGGDGTGDEEEPIDMRFPKGQGCKKITVYVISFPIMAPLYLTLPDTKNPTSEEILLSAKT